LKVKEPYRIIISGGGTGGHIFPALAIANEFRERYPDSRILFVGAKGRMEMTKVPEAGYEIIGLWISGLQRSLKWSNLLFPVKVLVSYIRASGIVKRFRPHVAVGTGGYASGPVMMAASRLGVPCLIQEQNSFAGLTNKQVAGRVAKVCVAYEGMEKYFPKEKLVITGNPVRKDILQVAGKRAAAMTHFGFDAGTRTLLVVGGSLGARTINESVLNGIEKLLDARVQVIWQTGKFYYESIRAQLIDRDLRKIRIYDFLKEMDLAYAAADVVISRAGAIAVSELCVTGKASILVPSPNVAEDHQAKNARALLDRDAAILIADREAAESLVDEALRLLFDEQKANRLSANILLLAKPEATKHIVNEVEKLLEGPSRPATGERQLTVMVMN
jgi:UDP-N-acetylglucosamine--N-acetylmuramyl-(pentapeptide) pyrophosphoryl-undecaprenol N-acetylglucosamine transferase